MNCRFCFRRNFAYEKEQKGFVPEIARIAQDRSITEILLSGGDPLSLSNRALQQLLHELDAIPHLKRVCFHTRFPVGIPEANRSQISRDSSKHTPAMLFCDSHQSSERMGWRYWQCTQIGAENRHSLAYPNGAVKRGQ